jgi:branched-chain amino acid transport system substrate-binding protein
MKADGCDLVVLGGIIREPIGAMGEAKKLGWDVTFLGTTPVNVLEVPALGKEVVEGLYSAGAFEIPLRRHGQRQDQGLAGQLPQGL